jgi:hypothetical protein
VLQLVAAQKLLRFLGSGLDCAMKRGHGLLRFRKGKGVPKIGKGFEDGDHVVAHVFYSNELSSLSRLVIHCPLRGFLPEDSSFGL